MAKRVQFIRHITSVSTVFTGLAGEITVDTTKGVTVVHDGITPGGNPNAREDLTTSPAATVVSDGKMSAAQASKLDGIEAGAEQNPTPAETKVDYESNADTNAFTDAEKTKLGTVETNAAADQTGAEIKVAYEAEADTNAYTDAEKTKLAGVATGAEVNPAPATQNELEVGTETAERVITPDVFNASVNTIAGFVGETRRGYFSAAPTGWLFLNGDTIGSATSGATHADNAMEDLFTALWNRANATASWDPVVGGKGVNAAADWSANKQLTLPDASGRVSMGSGTGTGLTNREPGDEVGTETHTLTKAELPDPLSDTVSSATAQGGPTFSAIGSGVGTQPVRNTEGGNAHNIMQPSFVEDVIIKYA